MIFNDISALYYDNIKNELIQLYHNNVLIVKNELLSLYNKFNTRFSLTFDEWTTQNQIEYLGITIHYIDFNFDLKSRMIDMKNLKERHSAQYILRVLKDCFTEFNIEDKILR
jgi:hypothetical protein